MAAGFIMLSQMLWHGFAVIGNQNIVIGFNPDKEVWIKHPFRWSTRIPDNQDV